jgi:uncharacterized membrane protein
MLAAVVYHILESSQVVGGWANEATYKQNAARLMQKLKDGSWPLTAGDNKEMMCLYGKLLFGRLTKRCMSVLLLHAGSCGLCIGQPSVTSWANEATYKQNAARLMQKLKDEKPAFDSR